MPTHCYYRWVVWVGGGGKGKTWGGGGGQEGGWRAGTVGDMAKQHEVVGRGSGQQSHRGGHTLLLRVYVCVEVGVVGCGPVDA